MRKLLLGLAIGAAIMLSGTVLAQVFDNNQLLDPLTQGVVWSDGTLFGQLTAVATSSLGLPTFADLPSGDGSSQWATTTDSSGIYPVSLRNVLIGTSSTSTDATLEVSGTGDFSGLLTLQSGANIGGATFTSLTGTGLSVSGGTLNADIHDAITLAGTPDYITLTGQVITRALINLGTHVTGTLGATNGGTGQTTVTTGDLLYGSASNVWSKRAVGSTGDVLSVVGGVPSWVSTSSLNISGGGGSQTPWTSAISTGGFDLVTGSEFFARTDGAYTTYMYMAPGALEFLASSISLIGDTSISGDLSVNDGVINLSASTTLSEHPSLGFIDWQTKNNSEYTLMRVKAPQVTPYEATLSLVVDVDGDNSGTNEEFIDFYNENYTDSHQAGIRSIATGAGRLKPFVMGFWQGGAKDAGNVLTLLPSGTTWFGHGTTTANLNTQIHAASTTATTLLRLDGSSTNRFTVSNAGNTAVAGTFSVGGVTTLETSLTGVLKAASGVVSAALVNLATEVTGRLAFSNLPEGTALSVVGRSANSTGDVANIAAGTDHQVLRRSGTTLGFGAINLAQTEAVTGTLGATNGGTGQGAVTTGDVLYGSGTNAWSRLGIGTTGQCLTVVAGLPAWGECGSGGGTPAGSTGQVQFNTSGEFAADADFHWDNTNKRLGIGTSTPQTDLHVVGTSTLALVDFGNGMCMGEWSGTSTPNVTIQDCGDF